MEKENPIEEARQYVANAEEITHSRLCPRRNASAHPCITELTNL